MKQRLLAWVLVFIGTVVSAVSLMSMAPRSVIAAAAVGTSGDNSVHLFVTLTGTNTTSGYTVTGTQKVTVNGGLQTNTYPFTATKVDGKNGYYDDNGIQDIGAGNCLNNPDYTQANQISITATSGSSSGSTTVDTCNDALGDIYPVTITVSAQQAQPASITGKIQFVSDNNGTKPITSSATGTLKGPTGSNSQTLNLSFSDQGVITGPASLSNLQPGSYTLTVNYLPTDPTDGTQLRQYTTTFTLAAGQAKDVSTVIADPHPQTGDGNPAGGSSTSGSSTKPTCESSGNIIGWILCGIYDTTAKVVDFLLNNFISPLLKTDPINTSSNCPADAQAPCATYVIWSNFRIYGDILLVIAVLVVVFAETIGGGLIDAYTVRKMLPRILVAAILINLSIYIVAFLVDITNILGAGIGQLLTAPLGNAGQFQFHLLGGQEAGISLGAVVAGGVGAWLTGILGVTGAGLAATASSALPAILLFVIMPAVLSLIAVLFTIVLRKGIILFLVLISPIAFALYVLPNTEKYFRRWWDLLFTTLLVYPLIVIFFAVADILSVTIMQANGSINGPLLSQVPQNVSTNFLAPLVSFVALFLPLILIPYSFRLAGGAIGKIHETITNYHKKGQEAVKGNANDPNSMRNRYRTNLGAAFTRNQAQAFRRFNGKRGFGALAGINAAAVEKEAMLIQASKQRITAVKDNGDDSIVNAAASFIDHEGIWGAKGDRRTLDGKKVSAAEYNAARRFYPNLSDMQAVADYRSTKVNNNEEAEKFEQGFASMAQQRGLTAEQATGMFTGLAFARQYERGEFKYGQYVKEDDGSFSYHAAGQQGSFAGDIDPKSGETVTEGSSRSANFIKEQYTKRGSWDASKMLNSHFVTMGDVKREHLRRLREGTYQAEADGPMLAMTDDMRAHSRGQVKQIMEMEDSFGKSGQYRDPETGQVVETGLSGASASTRSTFEQMQRIGTDNQGDRDTLSSIKAEIDSGDTYEAGNSGRPTLPAPQRPQRNGGGSPQPPPPGVPPSSTPNYPNTPWS